MSSSCMYSGMDLDHSYFSFSVTVYQFVNFLCFKCSTCAHLHTHKKNECNEIARNDECEYI